MNVRPKLLATRLVAQLGKFDLAAYTMRNPFKTRRTPAPPRSRLDRSVDLLLLLAIAGAIATMLAPGLFGVLVKASARTFGILLLFLMAARAISARIGEIFGGPKK